MRFDILTLFPNMCLPYLGESILKRAQEKGLLFFSVHDIRDFTTDKHHKADDTPYGGGAGMVLKGEPIFRAVEAVRSLENESGKLSRTRVILLSAKGQRFSQKDAKRLLAYDQLIFICGRYEGVDERVAEHVADEELSIGDFVLTGGELAALVVADAIARLVPGVLGNGESAKTESHAEEGVLEYPQYTKPECFNGWCVPDVLLSGNHAAIEAWRRAERRTTSSRTEDADSPQASFST